MKADIWMPLYIGDYLRDTMGLSAKEHGCYLLLLLHYWVEKKLTDDIDELMMIAKLSPDDEPVLKKILRKYFQHEDGCYIQKRIEEEIQRANTIRERNQKNARSRWDNTKTVPKRCETDAKSIPKRCSSQSQSPIDKDTSVSLSSAPSALSNEDRYVYHLIEQAFLQKNQDWNYGREGKHLLELEKKCLARSDPETFAKSIVALFWKLTHEGSDKIFRDQPFLPSILNSGGIWPRIVKKLEEMGEQQITQEDMEFWQSWARRAVKSDR